MLERSDSDWMRMLSFLINVLVALGAQQAAIELLPAGKQAGLELP
jgi:hypothetical protein